MPAPRPAAALLLSCGLAACAAAQCRVVTSGMPDFDQRRSDLGGNGSWFCVPTSACDLLAYFQNAGLANVFGGVAKDWQLQSNYDEVTARIAAMGVLMETDPDGGTSGGPDGLAIWLDTYAPDAFAIADCFPTHTNTPGVEQLKRARGRFGYETMINVVFYTDGPEDRFTAYGGHEVALGWFDPCTGEIGIRDPWTLSPESLELQSPFSTITTSTQPVAGRYDNYTMTLNHLPQYDPDGYWWGSRSIGLRFIWNHDFVFGVPKIKLIIPDIPELYGIQPEQVFDVPVGISAITSILPSADLQGAYVTTRSGIGNGQRLWFFDPLNNAWTSIAGVTMPAAGEPDAVLEVDRFNTLFLADNTILRRYDMGANKTTPTAQGSVNLGSRIGDLIMGDGSVRIGNITTHLWALLPDSDQLVQLESDLTHPDARSLPVAPGADGSISVNPETSELFLAAGTGGGIHRLARHIASGNWLVSETLSNAAIRDPRELEILPSGAVLFKSGSSTVVLERSGGFWRRANSPFDGLRFAGSFRMGRSRTNFTPGLHDLPGQSEIQPPARFTEIPDCRADFNDDGFLDFFDIDAFIACFEGAQCPRGKSADFNSDGFTDFFDADAFVEAFEAGC